MVIGSMYSVIRAKMDKIYKVLSAWHILNTQHILLIMTIVVLVNSERVAVCAVH